MQAPPPNKKFMYPETSTPYTLFIDPPDPDVLFAKQEKHSQLKPEPRPTFLKVGSLSTAKGSAYIEYGNTKVMASVQPPHELSNQTKGKDVLGKVSCTLKYAPFAVKDTTTISRKESSMSERLRKALEPAICLRLFPYFILEIKVIVLDDDGCALSTAINCCCAALLDAGIATYDIFAATTISIYKGVIVMNPNADMEYLISNIDENAASEEHGIVMNASLADTRQLTECYQRGYLLPETIARLMEHAFEINEYMYNIIRSVIAQKVGKTVVKGSPTKILRN